MALLLATSYRLLEAQHQAITDDCHSKSLSWVAGPGLAGATFGIAGFGPIGQAVAKRIKPFLPAKILYVNSVEIPFGKKIGAIKVTFETLLRESDFIICCATQNPKRKCVFDRKAFEKMGLNAIFISVGHSGLVDLNALVNALRCNQIRGAGIDVTTTRPLPVNNPLFSLKNCIVLPHIGSATTEARNTMCEMTALNILAALQNSKLISEVPYMS